MQKKTTLISIIFGTLMVMGCQASYQETINKKLENKSPQEKRIILAQECAKEIKRDSIADEKSNSQHSMRMQKICERMTNNPVMSK